MPYRKDALTAASECVLAIEKNAREFGHTHIVATVGKLNVKPNSANIIPDSVSFIMEIRTSCEEEKQAFLQKVTEEFVGIEKERGVSLTRIINGATSPTTIWFWTAANSVSTAAWKS